MIQEMCSFVAHNIQVFCNNIGLEISLLGFGLVNSDMVNKSLRLFADSCVKNQFQQLTTRALQCPSKGFGKCWPRVFS